MKHFPEVSEEIEDDEGLIHLEMGSLERLVNHCIENESFDYLNKIYEFIGDLARHQREVEPGIINAINVSFLEGLNFDNRKNGEKAKKLLPPVLLQMWKAQMEHNRKIGWMN
ncbi:MAG: hypothetical protein ABW170_17480 [Candidatus Thiodiazotropha sp. L084R]